MKTNYLMLTELLTQYTPKERGMTTYDELQLIGNVLCLNEMDVLQLRNLRDFTVAHLGHSDSLVDWDRMSAITYVIDNCIVKLGGEV